MECVVVPTTSKTVAKRKITLPAKRKAAISSEEDSDEEALEGLEESLDDEDDVDDDQLSKVTDDEEEGKEESNLEPGYYLVAYEGEVFPGKFEGKQNGSLVSVSCMQKAIVPGSTWKWPCPPDEHEYPRCDIQRKIESPIKISSGYRNIVYKVKELEYKWGSN